MKICIVGGVAGGASAATRLRRLDENAEILLFEKGEHISYANCGLPYYIGNVIKSEDALIVTQPELLRRRFRVDVRTQNQVLSVDRKNKKIKVKDLKFNREYEESYDKLILSPGAEPKRPSMPGMDLDGVFTMRTVSDTLKIDRFLASHSVSSAIVVGGGFIGVEMAENLKERGLDVTIVEFANQVVAPLDPEMANILQHHLAEHGVHLRLGTGITGIGQDENGWLAVSLTDEGILSGQMVLLSMGVAPENQLAKESGLELGMGGSIAVNQNYQTSDPDIYAVGDAIQVTNLISQKESLVPLAGPANKQGRIAAENALGQKTVSGSGVQGSSVLKVFDMTAASTGLNEKQAKALEIPYHKIYIHPQSHASYYSGATPVSMKMLFSPDGKVLGAQAVGSEGVDKRIDVMAAAIRLGGTVYDLEEMELCYAPPFASAKEPVNMLGFTAANLLKGDMPQFYVEDIPGLSQQDVTLLDVSTEEECKMGMIPGFQNIPLDELRENLNRLDQKKPVYVTCRVGLRGYIAVRILMQSGFQAYNLAGGYKTYDQMIHTDLSKVPIIHNQDGKKKRLDPDDDEPSEVKTITVDACGLSCPGPIMKVAENMKNLEEGQRLRVSATDPAFASDISMWCERTENSLLSVDKEEGAYQVLIRKGKESAAVEIEEHRPSHQTASASAGGTDKTMVVFSGDLDKAIASFIIANGAAAMGRKVTMLFTFWGLNILRRSEKISVKKNFTEKLLGGMMPRGSRKLKLSQMNMGGMGAKMIRGVMKNKNVSSLEELIASAMKSGVRILACQMSMDVMGIHKEELLPGVEVGGVATFLGAAETSDTNLFI